MAGHVGAANRPDPISEHRLCTIPDRLLRACGKLTGEMRLKRSLALLALPVIFVLAACGNSSAAPSALSKIATTGFGRVTGVVYPEQGAYQGFGANLWFIRSDVTCPR
jgi:hypothetical protein